MKQKVLAKMSAPAFANVVPALIRKRINSR